MTKALLLHRRRLPQTKALTSQIVLRDFQDLLGRASLPILNRFLALRPFGDAAGEAEMRDLFYTGRVVRVRVGSLGGSRVPDDIDLTNPRPDANGILHEYVNHDFARGVGEVTLRAEESDPDANVADSFYAKAVVASGTVEEVEAELDGKTVRRIRENRRATIEVDEPLTSEGVARLLERILRHDYQVTRADEQPTLFGPKGTMT